MSIDAGKIAKWPLTRDGWPWTFYLGTLIVATLLGLYLLLDTDIEEKTTVERGSPVAADGTDLGVANESELKLRKKTTETSIPIVAVITLLTAGGWLVIPLRYLWDERSKTNEHNREEIKLQGEHRRQTCSAMADRIHKYLDLYYARQLIVTGMIERASKRAVCAMVFGSEEDAKEALRGLLYRMAEYFVHSDWMVASGALLFLRSTAAEGEVESANRALADALNGGFGGVAVRRYWLERGVLPDGATSLRSDQTSDDQTRTPACVDMVEFVRRLEETDDDKWDDFRKVCKTLRDELRQGSLLCNINASARLAVYKYFFHLNATYQEWYEGDLPTTVTTQLATTATT